MSFPRIVPSRWKSKSNMRVTLTSSNEKSTVSSSLSQRRSRMNFDVRTVNGLKTEAVGVLHQVQDR